jgi:hypothetical protein
VTLVEQRASRSEVIMAFNNGWGWKDRKYVLTGNNGSGTLELQLTAKQTYDGFMVCDAPMCCGNGRVGLHDNVVMEMDGEDVMDNIEKEGNKGCMWVAHPMTPGVHTLGFKCVLEKSPRSRVDRHNPDRVEREWTWMASHGRWKRPCHQTTRCDQVVFFRTSS